MKRERLYLLCQTLGWSVHWIISLGFAFLYAVPGWKMFAAVTWDELITAYSTHLLRGWIKEHGWLQMPLSRTAPRVFAASLICGAAVTSVSALTSVFVFHFDRRPDWNWIYAGPSFFISSVVVFLWAVIYFGVHYFEGYREAQIEQLRLAVAAKDSELRVLLSQLNPHFIFNCLNSLRALITEDPGRAQSMVDELSSILRYSLKSGRVDRVPLKDEIDAISAYLKLELIRFEDRLRVSMDIDPASLAAEIPPMLLQTLVENGVKHGISRLAKGGEIRVVSRMVSNMGTRALRLQVINSGQVVVAAGNTTQIGIDNARERLRILYGSGASLALRNMDAASVLAEVFLPLAEAAP